MSQKRYYPTALALYITYFVLGISSSVMGHYKQEFAALWGAVPGADGNEIARKAIANKVAVVSGVTFNPVQDGASPSVRLNYSMPSDEQIVEGVKRLAEVL